MKKTIMLTGATDGGQFGPPHPDALDASKRQIVMSSIDSLISRLV